MRMQSFSKRSETCVKPSDMNLCWPTKTKRKFVAPLWQSLGRSQRTGSPSIPRTRSVGRRPRDRQLKRRPPAAHETRFTVSDVPGAAMHLHKFLRLSCRCYHNEWFKVQLQAQRQTARRKLQRAPRVASLDSRLALSAVVE